VVPLWDPVAAAAEVFDNFRVQLAAERPPREVFAETNARRLFRF